MVSPADPRDPLSPDGQLPPVEPPSASFIVQLFIVPALIVIILFAVGAGFKWLVDRGSDPSAYVEAIQRDNEARWQAAHDLADVLQKPGSDKLRRDPRLASELGRILDRQIDDARMDEESLKLRIYLCHALGEFQVAAVLPPLVKAASTQRETAEQVVRFSALKALAVFLDKAPSKLLENNPPVSPAQLEQLLVTSSRDQQPLIRSTSAFALGALDTPAANRRLRRMLADGYPDVRFNAATTLARHGDQQAIGVLVEMLDPDQAESVDKEEVERWRASKRELILLNGLRASQELAAHNSRADLDELARAADRLSRSNVPANVRVLAKDLRIKLGERSQPGS